MWRKHGRALAEFGQKVLLIDIIVLIGVGILYRLIHVSVNLAFWEMLFLAGVLICACSYAIFMSQLRMVGRDYPAMMAQQDMRRWAKQLRKDKEQGFSNALVLFVTGGLLVALAMILESI